MYICPVRICKIWCGRTKSDMVAKFEMTNDRFHSDSLTINQAVQNKFSTFTINNTIRSLLFQRCTVRDAHDDYEIWLFQKTLDRFCCTLICTRTRNEPVTNLSIWYQSMHSWITFVILLLVDISCENVCVNYNV